MPKKIYLFIALAFFFLLGLGAYAFVTSTPTQHKPATIVALGDSLTFGLGVPQEDNYPSQLEMKLKEKGYPATVINMGITGDTTADILARIESIKELHPDVVILGIGANDMLRGLPNTDTKKHIEDIIRDIKTYSPKVQILLLQMQATPHKGLAYKEEFDQIYPDIADEFSIPLVPFMKARIFLDASYTIEDRIHLNKKGYTEVVDSYILPAVVRILK